MSGKTDALGNVIATVTTSGQVINTYEYKLYGALLSKTGPGSDPSFQWVGSQVYRRTGKKYSDVYVRARHHNSLNSRWTTKDPIGFAGGDWNLSRYVENRLMTAIYHIGLDCPTDSQGCYTREDGCCEQLKGNHQPQDVLSVATVYKELDTSLWVAVGKLDVPAFKRLLQQGANPNAPVPEGAVLGDRTTHGSRLEQWLRHLLHLPQIEHQDA